MLLQSFKADSRCWECRNLAKKTQRKRRSTTVWKMGRAVGVLSKYSGCLGIYLYWEPVQWILDIGPWRRSHQGNSKYRPHSVNRLFHVCKDTRLSACANVALSVITNKAQSQHMITWSTTTTPVMCPAPVRSVKEKGERNRKMSAREREIENESERERARERESSMELCNEYSSATVMRCDMLSWHGTSSTWPLFYRREKAMANRLTQPCLACLDPGRIAGLSL